VRPKSIPCLSWLGKKIWLAFFFVVLSGFIFPGSSPATAAAPPEKKILVAASILPLGDFCRHLGGDRVEVQVLIPPGASPHVFEPTPSVIAKANRAPVFVYIGAGLEPWAERILRARGSQNLTVVEAAAGMPLLMEAESHHKPEESHKAESEEHKHGHEGGNPHIWLDPVLAKDICRRIAAALIKVDPAHAGEYEANLKTYLASLDELDREYRSHISTWSRRGFISFHPAYSYLAKRYGLQEVGVMELAPGREPTPRHMQELVAAIRSSGIRVVFAEPQLNPRVAQVVAREAGVKVLMLDPIGGRPPYDSDYLKLMRYNLAAMAEAMK
jgi:zinc transport system substrate-binding protein